MEDVRKLRNDKKELFDYIGRITSYDIDFKQHGVDYPTFNVVHDTINKLRTKIDNCEKGIDTSI